jgi:hypothetical protein
VDLVPVIKESFQFLDLRAKSGSDAEDEMKQKMPANIPQWPEYSTASFAYELLRH